MSSSCVSCSHFFVLFKRGAGSAHDVFASFAPWPHGSIEQRSERPGVDDHAHGAIRNIRGQLHHPLVEAFAEQTPARRITPEELQEVSSTIDEQKHQAFAGGVASELLLHRAREAVE